MRLFTGAGTPQVIRPLNFTDHQQFRRLIKNIYDLSVYLYVFILMYDIIF